MYYFLSFCGLCIMHYFVGYIFYLYFFQGLVIFSFLDLWIPRNIRCSGEKRPLILNLYHVYAMLMSQYDV